MAKIIDSSYLKITADEAGNVWAIDGDKLPKITSDSTGEFVDALKSSGRFKLVRVLAAPINHKIIPLLYDAKAEGCIDSLQLASPIMHQKSRPESSLIRMRLCTLPPSLGGWHEMTYDESLVYKMSNLSESALNIEPKFKKNGCLSVSTLKKLKDIDDSIEALIVKHPIFKYMSFIDDIRPHILGSLIGKICDPRWFVDPNRPDRLSKLFSWVGLCGNVGTVDKDRRRIEALICWAGTEMYGFNSYKNSSELLSNKIADPGCFILKYACDKWGMDFNKWPIETITKYFIKFLRLAWLDCIYPYPNPWMERLFDYSYFFKNREDLKAFTSFIKK
jgi:hypothetical protein